MTSEGTGRSDLPAHAELASLRGHTETHLGPPEDWAVSPGGYPDSLAQAILDTVYSVGATYNTVVQPLVQRYRDHRRATGAEPTHDGARELAATIRAAGGAEAFADILGNHQRAWRRKTAPLKATAALHAATALETFGVTSTVDFVAATAADRSAVESVWRSTPGQRSRTAVGWDYLCILTGGESVKADTMIRRYVSAALHPSAPEAPVGADHAKALVHALAVQLGVSVSRLDHAIWAHQRAQTQR